MTPKNSIPPYYIYNRKFTFEDAFALLSFVGIIAIVLISDIGYFALIYIPFLGFYLYRLALRLQQREAQLTINHKGIIKADGRIMTWDKIEHAFVAFLNPTSKSRTYALFIHSKEGKTHISLDDYKYDKEKLKAAVEYFSNRDIGDQKDKLRDDIIKIIGKENDIDTIMHIFKSYANWGSFITILLLFGFVGIGIYFQVAYRYWLAIGTAFAISVIVLHFLIKTILSLAQERPTLRNLSKDQILKIAILYSIAVDPKNNRNNILVFLVISLIIVVANFFINQDLYA